MTGQNKVWLAGNVLVRALLQEDKELVRQARDTIVSEIVTGQTEGIQPDWSFHQHGTQQQFGNYGLAFLASMSFYSGVLPELQWPSAMNNWKSFVSLLIKDIAGYCGKAKWTSAHWADNFSVKDKPTKVFLPLLRRPNWEEACPNHATAPPALCAMRTSNFIQK